MSEFAGKLLLNEPMAKHTSWRVGGPVDRLYKPASLADAQAFLRQCKKDEPIMFTGLGSNLLVRDGGLRGTVVKFSGVGNTLEKNQTDAGESWVTVGAGVSCAKLAKQTAEWGFAGSAFFAGIPGCLGGALAMNAGCYGSETWDVVKSVVTVDRAGELHIRGPKDFDIAYRHCKNKYGEEWFVGADLVLPEGDAEKAAQEIKTLLATRAAAQPLNQRSCGSVFRNPQGDHAARLIEAAGLKGFKMGGAEVSEKHANFILNAGEATAADIENLIAHVHQTVATRFGVELIREVQIIGEAA